MSLICVDGFNLAIPKGSGIATYGRNLISSLNTLGARTGVLYGPQAAVTRDRLLDTIVLTDAPQPKGKPEKIKRWARTVGTRFGRFAAPVTPSSDVIWSDLGGGKPPVDQLWAAHKLYDYAFRSHRAYGHATPVYFSGAGKPDAMHWTCPLPLRAPGMTNIYTFHDLIPLKLPHTTGEDKQSYLAMCREVVARADHLLAVSDATRRDVMALLDVPEDRITTTYQSVSLPQDVVAEDDAAVGAYVEGVFDLGWKDYFLFYGAMEPKKNVARIVEAYLKAGISTPLVIVGGRAWLDNGEAGLIASVVDGENTLRAGRIRKYDFLSAAMLARLVRGAKATLFPSLYEGFGLPVLESMLLGTAVLTSTGGSLPEIAGDAALMVDPYDVDAICQGIRTLDGDAARVDDLVARGHVRALAFSPAAHEAHLRSVYGRLGLI